MGIDVVYGGEEFERLVGEYVYDDNKHRFLEFLKEIRKDSYWEVFLLCLYHRAKECALAMLRGEVPGYPMACLDTPEDETPLLLTAIEFLSDPQVLGLVIEKHQDRRVLNQRFLGYLPIHFALDQWKNLECLSTWAPGQSLIKLIILLCQSETKTILEAMRVVAEHTDALRRVALGFVLKPGMKELACLLLVAHKRVLAPFSSSGCTISELIEDAIVSPNEHGHALSALAISGINLKCSNGAQIKRILEMGEKLNKYIQDEVVSPNDSHDDHCLLASPETKLNLTNGAALLRIFEKAGDVLSLYFRSQPEDVPPEVVTFQVADLLQKSGLQLTYDDINLTDVYRFPSGVMGSLCKRLGIEMGSTFEKAQIDFVPPSPCTNTGETVSFSHLVTKGFVPSVTALSNNQGIREFSTTARQVHRISIQKKHALGNPSVRAICNLALRLKRGIRFL